MFTSRGYIYIRVMNGDVSGSRQYMSPAPSDVVQFLYFGAYFRLFLANFVLLILDGDIFLAFREMLCMFHACDIALRQKSTPSRGNTTNTTRGLLGGEVPSTSSRGSCLHTAS